MHERNAHNFPLDLASVNQFSAGYANTVIPETFSFIVTLNSTLLQLKVLEFLNTNIENTIKKGFDQEYRNYNSIDNKDYTFENVSTDELLVYLKYADANNLFRRKDSLKEKIL